MVRNIMHVAEKPSVAKEISRVMAGLPGGHGAPRPGQSASRFNAIWEFTFNGDHHFFTSVAGHLLETDFAAHAKSWRKFPLQELFWAPIEYKVKDSNKDLERNLTNLANRCSKIILWLDCDREGENICFEVLSVVRGAKPGIAVERARFSALTQRDIERALRTLVQPDQRAADAVKLRQELDLRIGAAFTRFQSILFQDYIEPYCRMPEADAQIEAMRAHNAQNRGGFHGGNNNNNVNNNRRPPYSFGPCQFPCLGFIVSRYWEHENFIRENFWSCQFDYEGAKFTWSRGNIFDRDVVGALVENMLREASNNNTLRINQISAKITSVSQRPTRKFAPAPLATVELQKLSSQHLHISAERCMDIAEKLYQEGIISYPRTETDGYTFTDDELKALAEHHTNPAAPWHAFANDVTHGDKYRRPRNGGHDDKAHPPIHPLKFVDMPVGGGDRNADQRARLYHLICRHFIATMLPEAEAGETNVAALVAREEFRTSGFAIISRGWLDCFTYDRTWTNNRTLPNFAVDQIISPLQNLQVHEGQTQPPALLSEAQLIAEMDTFGIGTDATIAGHIKTVQDRGYVVSEADGARMRPTELGIALAAAYDSIAMGELWRPQLRAQTEQAMLHVAQGTANKDVVMNAFCQHYANRFQTVQRNAENLIRSLRKCLPRIGDANNNNNNNNNRRNGLFNNGRMMRGGGGGAGGNSSSDDDNSMFLMAHQDDDEDDDDDDDQTNSVDGGDARIKNPVPGALGGRVIAFLQGKKGATADANNNHNNNNNDENSNTNHQEHVNNVILDPCPGCGRGSLDLIRMERRNEQKQSFNPPQFYKFLGCSLRCGNAAVYFRYLLEPQSFPKISGKTCRCGATKMEFGLTNQRIPVFGADPDEPMCFKCDSRLHEGNHIFMKITPMKNGSITTATSTFVSNKKGKNSNNNNNNNNDGNSQGMFRMNNNNNLNSSAASATEYQLPQLASERQTARQAGAEKKQREQQINNSIDGGSGGGGIIGAGQKCTQCSRPIMIRVSKSAKNPGKKFYTCGTSTCGFKGFVEE